MAFKGSSFIKGELFCLFQFSSEHKTSVSTTYRVRESLHYDATLQLFGECQLHTFYNKNIVNASINAQNHQNLRIV